MGRQPPGGADRPVPSAQVVGGTATTRLDRRVRKEAKGAVREARAALKSRVTIGAEDRVALERDTKVLADAVAADDLVAVRRALPAVDAGIDKVASAARKSPLREYAESIGVALAIALLLRAFVVEAFKIPSASMVPTMEIGDFIFVNKFLYGVRIPYTDTKLFEVRSPERGEVIVFKRPCQPETDFIKRIVAVAGDTVEVRCDVLWVNGKRVDETLVDGQCTFWNAEKNGDWIAEPHECSRYRATLGGHEFELFHDRDRPVRERVQAQGFGAFWQEEAARRRAQGASEAELEGARAHFLRENYPSVDSDVAELGPSNEFPSSRVPGDRASPGCDTAARNLGRVVRTAPEPDPANPTCTPRLHYVVPPGHVFAMGDNRNDSHDSRFLGPVAVDQIKGKAVFIWLSMGPPHLRDVKKLNPFAIRYERIGNFVH